MKNFEDYVKSEGILHDILGVEPGASADEVKAAFKEKAKQPVADGIMGDLKYARKILLKKQAEYEAAGDDRWFKDRRRRRLNTPRKLSAEPAAKKLVLALKMGRWKPLRSGITDNGEAWAAAYHNSIEELGHPEGEVLFRIAKDRSELYVYYDAMRTAGPHSVEDPPGKAVTIPIGDGEKIVIGDISGAVKVALGNAASELYNARRRKLGRYFIPEVS